MGNTRWISQRHGIRKCACFLGAFLLILVAIGGFSLQTETPNLQNLSQPNMVKRTADAS